MNASFVDRLLVCSDCHTEFIFTAGEQLFFHDKQFKNDPKRCKPCKSRRSGLAAAAQGIGAPAAGLARTETRTQCSECGVETTVPFKPTQGRPVLCRQCFQTRNHVAATLSRQPSSGGNYLSAASTAETASALTEASVNSGGSTLSPAAALLAAVSMASASASSSVSSAADLASIRAVSSVAGVPVPGRAQPVSTEVVHGQAAVLLGK